MRYSPIQSTTTYTDTTVNFGVCSRDAETFMPKDREQAAFFVVWRESQSKFGRIWRHCMKCMSLRRLRGGQFVSTTPTTSLPGRRQPNSKWTSCLWRISAVAVGILTLSSTLVAQHYYVSPNGNDNNSGTSTSSPWQTIARINNFTFPEGSVISFQAGQTFTGCLVFNINNVPSSSASMPFTVNSYGTGTATIVSNCSGMGAAAITGDNVHGFTIDGLRIVNGGSTKLRAGCCICRTVRIFGDTSPATHRTWLV